MMTAALHELGLDHWTYQALPVPPDAIRAAFSALAEGGFAGANVTMPHKHDALVVADHVTVAAREIGAANTLTVLGDGTLEADNTDAPGLLDAIGTPVVGRSALVLGAGGSARGCVWALRQAGCSRVAVWNRTAARAAELAHDLQVDAVTQIPAADILVHCTSVGLHDPTSTFDLLPVDADTLGTYDVVVDLVYRDGGTALLQAAAAAGTTTVDGLQMLVAQGAHSLARWTGREAPRAAMLNAIVRDSSLD